ncbi:hypothetical protein GQ53DRAFT_836411 [Thozetella sp. PMI_491]|nr:hypothetical protein GQ53DRAFT_836411 [Thozetella sp. PMI_491]
MATNRQERMQERMRGAQRHQIEDESFGFIVPITTAATDAPPPSATPSPVTAPTSPGATSSDARSERLVDEDDGETPRPLRNRTQDTEQLATVAGVDAGGYESEELDSDVTPLLRRRLAESELPPAKAAGADGEGGLDTTPLAPGNILDAPSSTQAFIAEAIEELTADVHYASVQKPTSTSIVRGRRSGEALSSPIQRLATERSSARATGPRPPRQPDRGQEPNISPLRTRGRGRPQAPQSSSPARGNEVGESPAEAPGSGKRRFVSTNEAARSSSRLQEIFAAVDSDTQPVGAESLEATSPLLAKSQQSRRLGRRKSVAQQVEAEAPDEVETTPPKKARGRPRKAAAPTIPEPPAEAVEQEPREESQERENAPEVVQPTQRTRGRRRQPPPQAEASEEEDEAVHPTQRTRGRKRQPPPQAEASEEEDEAAQEIDDQEAARTLGVKRPRRSLRDHSPEPEHEEVEAPQPKRRRKNARASPAAQSQPQPKARGRPKGERKRTGGEERQPPVAITVNRFNKVKLGGLENAEHAELLGGEIPYANRGGVNAIDVLSQLCEDMIDRRMEKLRENVENLTTSSQRRENTTMRMALEAFQEELRTRFLEHSHALDNAHALQKRIREAQKRKIELRERVMRTRAEKEKVLLRQDAVRIRHEAQRKEAMRHIAISSSMHDIDMAIEKGQTAAEPTRAQKKEAELANLELLVSQVTDQACSRSASGGVYRQLKDFNDFLERTAEILERKARQ